MQSLIANKCIKFVDYDKGSEEQTGEIGFYGGELYEGEITNKQPKGWGRLQLPDGSYYEGNFDTSGMTDGRFVHFSKDYFEGRFQRDKCHKGTLYFRDGDSLEGEWAMERMKWNLRNGQLRNEEKIGICTFGKESKEIVIINKHKTVHKMTDNGFTVKYESYTLPNTRRIHNLSYTCEGTISYENKITDDITERITTKLTSQLPLTKIEQYKDNILIKTIHKICFGFIIEHNGSDFKSKISFSDLNGITGNGVFEIDKIKFKFKGSLLYKDNELGPFYIKKNNFIDLKIKFNKVHYEDMNEFCKYIGCVIEERYYDSNVYVFTRHGKLEKAEQDPEVMKDIISDIKTHNECVIM